MPNQNSKKTHCFRGHLLSGDNAYFNPTDNRRYCRACWAIRRDLNREHLRQYAREHYHKHKEQYKTLRRIQGIRYTERIKKQVLTYYGNGKLACVCCREETYQFLTLDHIKNNGASERRIVRRTGHNLYRYLIKMKYPPDYQTLCFNCNSGKQINKGLCPHKQIKTIISISKNQNISYKIDPKIKEGDRPRLS